MILRIGFTAKEEAWINGQATILGVSPDDVVRRVVDEKVPAAPMGQELTNSATKPISAKNAATIAYLDARIRAEATTDPDELQEAAAEYEELKRNLNANRLATS